MAKMYAGGSKTFNEKTGRHERKDGTPMKRKNRKMNEKAPTKPPTEGKPGPSRPPRKPISGKPGPTVPKSPTKKPSVRKAVKKLDEKKRTTLAKKVGTKKPVKSIKKLDQKKRTDLRNKAKKTKK